MNKKDLLYKFILNDILASTIVWALFMLYRKTVVDAQLFANVKLFIPHYDFLSGFVFFPFACVLIHYIVGFYRQPHLLSRTNVFFSTLVASAFISMILFFVLMLDDVVISYRYYYYSLLVLFGLLFIATIIARSIVYSTKWRKIKSKIWTINTLIVGTGKNALQMSEQLKISAPEYTFIGFVSALNQNVEVPRDAIVGFNSNIGEVIKKHNIKNVIIALDKVDEFQLFQLINNLYVYDIDIQFIPRIYEILTAGSKIKMMGISPLVNITTLNMPDWQFSVKRLIDLAVSFTGLLLCIPLFVYIAIKVKCDTKGPIFFKQERIGYLGKPFNIIKFRTMNHNSENGLPQLSSALDHRITPFGRFLRKYRLDELPQLWNVLRGDMSLVGPRPERKFFIDKIIEQAPYYCLLYKIRPGLTSWGPIRIGYADTVEKMIERLNYDIIYLDNMSLFTDFKIMFQTIDIIFKGKGI